MIVKGQRKKMVVDALVGIGKGKDSWMRVDMTCETEKWSRSTFVSTEEAKKLHVGMKVDSYETLEFEE